MQTFHYILSFKRRRLGHNLSSRPRPAKRGVPGSTTHGSGGFFWIPDLALRRFARPEWRLYFIVTPPRRRQSAYAGRRMVLFRSANCLSELKRVQLNIIYLT